MLSGRRRLALAFAVFVATDLAIGHVLGDVAVLGRPLPPVARELQPHQREALEAWKQAGRPATDAFGQGLRYDPVLGWEPRPSPPSQPGRTPFDELGARGGDPRPEEPEPGVLRVAAFGDSMTFGAGVGASEAWPAALERARPRTEALNFGVPGYGTDQALLRYRRVGRAGAQVVVLGVFVENIKRNVNRYRPLLYPGTSPAMLVKSRFLLEGHELKLLEIPYGSRSELMEALESGRARAELGVSDGWAEPPWPDLVWRSGLARLAGGGLRWSRSSQRLWRDADGEPYRLMRALVLAFHREALAAGAQRALVLWIPTEEVLAAAETPDHPYWNGMARELAAEGVELLDLLPALCAARDREGLGALFERGHLTPRGHAVVAEALAARLDGDR